MCTSWHTNAAMAEPSSALSNKNFVPLGVLLRVQDFGRFGPFHYKNYQRPFLAGWLLLLVLILTLDLFKYPVPVVTKTDAPMEYRKKEGNDTHTHVKPPSTAPRRVHFLGWCSRRYHKRV